jgi:mono/diheme cytochrome c family protein
MRQLPFQLLSIFLALPATWAAAPGLDAASAALDQSVLPILDARCLDCHDSEMKKGDVDLGSLFTPGKDRHHVRLWDKIREQVRSGTMPPPAKKPLDAEQKKAVLDWIAQNEAAVLASPPKDPGVRKVRRLNREEYSNTLRDLFGITSRPGEKFPADGAGGEGFANNADTLTFSPLLIEKFMGGAEETIREVFRKPELRQRLLAPVTSDKLPAETGADLALRPFLKRAYRRPVTEGEVRELLDVFNAALKRGRDWDGAMQVMFKAALMSPKFLFLEERPRPEAKAPWKVDHYEMASRLSYFLWASMPDDHLLKLAGEQRLHDPAVLATETKRLLADPKGLAFTKNFAGQWLHFEQLFVSVDPDRRKFKDFNDTLRQAMYDEVFTFCDAVLRHNGRVLDLLDSDYTFVNEPLAKLYDIPGVQGKEMRRVSFTDDRRGGLTGMGAILAVTSLPQRTSPVLRGKWVLEQLLSAPPPPPPPNVGELPEDDRALKGDLTFRQRLEQHRSKPACAGCHVRMDPLGFGLENFNAIGQWRSDENGKPLDASGRMPDGTQFSGPAEMRKVLLQEKAMFLRTVCARLLGYALNRGLEVEDHPTLLRLEEVLRKNDYRSEPLIIAVVQSYPFLHRRLSVP